MSNRHERRVRLRAGIALACASVILSATLASGDSQARFSHERVATSLFTGEPGVVVVNRDGPDEVIISAPTPWGSRLWRATDGPFQPIGTPVGTSGDVDIARNGRQLYSVDLRDHDGATTLPLSLSHDDGMTFSLVANLSTDCCTVDRPWLTPWGSGVAATALDTVSRQIPVWVVSDEGIFAKDSIGAAVEVTGKPAMSSAGIHVPYVDENKHLRVATSSDLETWDDRLVYAFPEGRPTSIPNLDAGDPGWATGPFIFPSLAVDDLGALHVTWSASSARTLTEAASRDAPTIFLASSADGGRTWGPAHALTPPTEGSILPWIAAGGDGLLAIAYISSSWTGIPEIGGPMTEWDLRLLTIDNAATTTPTVSRQVVAANIHTGSVCTEGAICFGPQRGLIGKGNLWTPYDRRLLDFLQIAIDDRGEIMIAYVRDTQPSADDVSTVTEPTVDVWVARQTSATRHR